MAAAVDAVAADNFVMLMMLLVLLLLLVLMMMRMMMTMMMTMTMMVATALYSAMCCGYELLIVKSTASKMLLYAVFAPGFLRMVGRVIYDRHKTCQ